MLWCNRYGWTEVLGIDCESSPAIQDNGLTCQKLTQVGIVSPDRPVYNTVVKSNNVPFVYYNRRFTYDEMLNAIPYYKARHHVNGLIKRKIIVGHNLDSDLELLNIKHDKNLIRDTATFPPFKAFAAPGGAQPKLSVLAHRLLHRKIQSGNHSPIEDARASLELYMLFAPEWEAWLQNKTVETYCGPPRMQDFWRFKPPSSRFYSGAMMTKCIYPIPQLVVFAWNRPEFTLHQLNDCLMLSNPNFSYYIY